MIKRFFLTSILLCCAFESQTLFAEAATILTTKIFPGQTLLIEAPISYSSSVLKFNNQEYSFFEHPKKPAKLIALIPTPFELPPGSHDIELSIKTPDQVSKMETLSFTSQKEKYRTIIVSVSKEKTELSPESKQRADLEWERVKKIFSETKLERLWKDSFVDPVKSAVTSEFGVKRMFNNTVQSFHRGIDLRAAPKTKIKASNAGIVKLADDLFYAGNQVIIDHGHGVFTSYAHLSKILVAPGQTVKRGEVVGLSGATGRVSGPHLHWGVSIAGYSVDPIQFKKVTSTILK